MAPLSRNWSLRSHPIWSNDRPILNRCRVGAENGFAIPSSIRSGESGNLQFSLVGERGEWPLFGRELTSLQRLGPAKFSAQEGVEFVLLKVLRTNASRSPICAPLVAPSNCVFRSSSNPVLSLELGTRPFLKPKKPHDVAFFFWCSGRDSNPYTFRHTPLKRACLPIPPPEQLRKAEKNDRWALM